MGREELGPRTRNEDRGSVSLGPVVLGPSNADLFCDGRKEGRLVKV